MLNPMQPAARRDDAEVLVRADGAGKKFCRNLKRSLWYGMQDIATELSPWRVRGPGATTGVLRRDEFWAVDDVSFELRRGECLGIIGHNGAGKTTLLKMLNGLLKPDRGSIETRGRVGGLIALGAGFNPVLTGRENVYVNGAVLGLGRAEIDARFDEIVEFAELAEFIDTPVQSYSSGMQVRLGFAIASVLEPDVLILDEVLAVGDAAFRVKSFNRIEEILRNAAVLFVSHNMSQVTRICTRVLVLDGGRAIADETDLGSAILQYRRALAPPERKSVAGSGRWVINAITVGDDTERNTDALKAGSPFTVTVGTTLRDSAPVPSPRVMLIFVDEEGHHVAEVLEPVTIPPAARAVSVTLSFPEALFNAGRFRISAALLSGPAGELGSVMFNAATFDVERSVCGHAPMVIRPHAIRVS